jgi:hypothetical protein
MTEIVKYLRLRILKKLALARKLQKNAALVSGLLLDGNRNGCHSK